MQTYLEQCKEDIKQEKEAIDFDNKKRHNGSAIQPSLELCFLIANLNVSQEIRRSYEWGSFVSAISKKILYDNDKQSLKTELIDGVMANSIIKYAEEKKVEIIDQNLIHDFEKKFEQIITKTLKTH